MEKVRLGDIFEYMPKSKMKAGEGKKQGKYKFFTSSNIQDKYIDEFIYDGEYLIFGTGGKASINYCNGKFSTSTDNFVVKVKKEINAKLIYLYFKNDMQKLEKGFKGASIKHISKDYINQLMIPMYDLKIQEKIVKQLDKIQEIIDLRKKQIEELDELIKSQFAQVTKDIIDEVELNYFAYGLNAGKSLVGEAGCKNKVLKTGSVSYDHFDKNEIKNLPINYIPNEKHKVKKGDVIISRMNTTELVGACGYVWNDIENVYYPDRLWRLNLKQNCNPIFIWQSIIQKKFKEKIKLICSGTSGSMKNISQEKFLKLTIKNVPKELQDKFAELVKKINKQKYMLEKNLKETEELKESLMNKYFG